MSSIFSELLGLWTFSNPAESQVRFQARLDTLGESGSTENRAATLTQLARAKGLQKQFTDAHATLDVAEGLSGGSVLLKVLVPLERGRVYRSSGTPELAKPLFLAAYEEASKHPQDPAIDSLAVDAAHMVALASVGEEEQLRWTHLALDHATASAHALTRRWRASLLNNLAWTHHDAERYTLALELFQQAVTEREKGTDAMALHIARWSVARTLRSLARHDEALVILRQLEAGAPPDPYVTEEIQHNLTALAASK